MRAVILYDNAAAVPGVEADWGFACFLETGGKKILFDTGADGRILMNNMRLCGVEPADVDMVFISHAHWDHAGGLEPFMSIRRCPVFAPASALHPRAPRDFFPVRDALWIDGHLCSTGELAGIEQSLVLQEDGWFYVVVGCSHPGVSLILDEALRRGPVCGILGGLHDCRDFDRLAALDWICGTHCTFYQDEMRAILGSKFIPGGVGRELMISGARCRSGTVSPAAAPAD
ncbi:MBL fold metallo-hydrolase [Desulfatiglans anilini]|uniref:MBL fold metallo-hydrolase n=1 Tax=Desulfatiglans anilini TaxID=90728 RepID=UPI0004262B04|nr:MBL fold metallo-hydrolase [Desulfatiglans anilini]